MENKIKDKVVQPKPTKDLLQERPDYENVPGYQDFEPFVSPIIDIYYEPEKESKEEDISPIYKGTQYYEIMPTFTDIINKRVVTESYNTLGLNNENLEQSWVKAQMDISQEAFFRKYPNAEEVFLNGPRTWVLDIADSHTDISPKVYGKVFEYIEGLKLQLGAQITYDKDGVLFGKEKPYQEQLVHRWTTWVYLTKYDERSIAPNRGKLYVLVDERIDDAHVYYVMQSVLSEKVDLQDLPNLTLALLPPKWFYKELTLTQNFELVTVGKAYVIHDCLENGYQRVPDDQVKKLKLCTKL